MNQNKYKFEDEDFVIFKEGIFSKNKDNIFKELITNSYGKGLPIIPGVYFKENDENIGSKIINTYFTIDNNFKKLTLIKDMILNIIEINSYDLKKINVPRERYQLYDDNIIISFKDSINNTFKDKEKYGAIEKVTEKGSTALGYNPLYYGYNKFIDKFIENNYVLLKNNYDTLPTFLNIFNAEYKTENSDSKSYFLKLFQEYVDVRNVLLNYIKSDYGLLAFKFFFDINLAKDYKLQQNKVKKESTKNRNVLNNLSSYELFNESASNVKKNFELKTIFINNTDDTKYILIEILEDQAYQYKLINNDGKIFYAKENIDGNLIGDDDSTIYKKKTNNKINKIDKKLFVNKINKANFLYINLMTQDYYKNEQQKNINIYYNNLKTSIDNFVGNDIDNTLYGITKNSLETDFNTLKFIFNYVEQINFNKSVDIHFEIKKYISTKINNLEKNYGRYVDWYYKFIGLMSSNINRNGITSDSDFKTFFDTLFKDIEKTSVTTSSTTPITTP